MNPDQLGDRLHSSALALYCSAVRKNGLPSTMQDESALARVCVRAARVLLHEEKRQLEQLVKDEFEA